MIVTEPWLVVLGLAILLLACMFAYAAGQQHERKGPPRD